MTDHSRAYSEGAFKTKLGAIAGLESLIQAAKQVHALLRDPATPMWIKGLCIAVLGYLILPTDAVADFVPVLGHGDDLAALTAALTTIATHLPKKSSAEG
ncbi:MAG TPA: DUF1232 domain-containing protein [Vitreimonas sp.]|uniref:YkvA family protein n=1 Tax=Vitreimonas sp. TaxID=3069702 RepID=UPI002D28BBC8|nr:DUF1232 domain-containing protein [Vitreimonas sp.]HYD88362.1 DUF1232 domain-containing protein [Vitreimonas sp.]